MLKKIVGAIAIVCLMAGIASAGAKRNPVVTMNTSLGSIKIELFEQAAPISVRNFLGYAKSGFYNGTIFHRVIPDFMVQGGGFTAGLTEKATGAPIKNEAGNGLKNDRGTVAMARTSAPDSATAQFFINIVSNDRLNRPNPDGVGYAVFGKVVEGMDVVDRIAAVKTRSVNFMFENLPETPVTIKSVKLLK